MVANLHCFRPAAFDDSPTGPAWAQGDAANDDEEQKGGEEGDEKGAQPDAASSSKGFTMMEDRFAHMHVNRNRRKGHFDDEEEEDDSDDE